MGLYNKLGRLAKKYGEDTCGQFAVITALVGLPLLLIGAAAVDVNKAHSQNEGLRAAIDAAALAAVIPDNMSQAERYAYAQTVFDKNYFGRNEVSLDISGDRERVDIVATSQVPTMISGILGIDYVSVKENTAAELTRSDVVCLLILDPTGDRSLEFADRAVFNSPACSVQVNSTSPFAMVSGVVAPPIASSFCVTGISQGVFTPRVKHACSPVTDPYANLTPPDDGPCVDVKEFEGDNKAVVTLTGLVDQIGDNAVLYPGTYCDGLEIEGTNVTFMPGVYIIKKDGLEFEEYAGGYGRDVTFILKGEKARLKIKDNSQVYLKAPITGEYAGLVFYQAYVADNGKRYKENKKKKASEISSGGGLNIIGTAYFPTQELIITSLSPVVTQSPATSFIAYRMKIAGRANMVIRVDHEAGGIPPLLPRSDDGARLVK